MNFGWLKRFFKKNNSSNTNTSDISTIDTSFIHIPKLSKLSKQDRKKVLEYIEEIKILQAENSHKFVLKYGSDLLNKSNSEIEFFMINLDEIIKEISSIINNTTQDNYFKLLLSKEEIKQSIDEFYNILNEAKLRLTALDVYIKKEEIRKYDFLGIFGMSERLRYLADKNTLLNERDMLKTTIKIANGHLLAAYKALKEEELLLNEMERYINCSKLFNTKRCNDQVCQKYAEKLLEKKKIIDKYDYFSELYYLVNICKEIYGIDHGLYLDYIAQKKMDKFLPYLEYQRLIPFLVKESRKIKKYSYLHRNDYKIYLDEMKAIINKYEKTFTSNWNKQKLQNYIKKYAKELKEYTIICNKYLTKDAINELKYTLNHMFFLNDLINQKANSIILEYDEHFYTLEDRVNYDKYAIFLANELLKKVEDKYGVALNIPVHLFKKEDVNNRIEFINKYYIDYFIYFYDLLNGNLKVLDTELDFNKKYDEIKNKYKNNGIFFTINDNISCEEFFYIMKFLNLSFEKYRDIAWQCNTLIKGKEAISTTFAKYITSIKLKVLEENYDKRILIVSNSLFIGPTFYKPDSNKIKPLNNEKAIYISDIRQLDYIKYFANELGNVKYLFVKENIMLQYSSIGAYYLKKYRGVRVGGRFDETDECLNREIEYANKLLKEDTNIKIITVPNNIEYEELSTYLDKWLIKDNRNDKLKTKTLCK